MRLLLYGHTHEPRIYEATDGRVHERELLTEVALAPDRLTFINPGSVDAARKRVPRELRVRYAELCILDSERWSVGFLRVPYDHAASEARARAGGYRITPTAARVYGLRRWLINARAAASRRLVLGDA